MTQSTSLAVQTIIELTQERMALRQALRDILLYYDRASGNLKGGNGWTHADAKKIQEARELCGK